MKSRGFTLIELIIILVIIGILAVSAGPVFFDNSGTQSQTLRLRAISILRSIQLQAMQDRRPDQCHLVVVDDFTLGKPVSSSGVEDCLDPELPPADQPPFTEETNRQIRDSGSVRFAVLGASTPVIIGFDGLGQPTGAVCENGCTITLSGADRGISINKEGFIDAR